MLAGVIALLTFLSIYVGILRGMNERGNAWVWEAGQAALKRTLEAEVNPAQ